MGYVFNPLTGNLDLTAGTSAIGIPADRITEGDSEVEIGTDTGNIVFKDNSDTEWLTFDISDKTYNKLGHNTGAVAETVAIYAKDGMDLLLKASGETHDIIMRSDNASITLSAYAGGIDQGSAIRYITTTVYDTTANPWEGGQTWVTAEFVSTSGSGVGAEFSYSTNGTEGNLDGTSVTVHIRTGGKNYSADDTVVIQDGGSTSQRITLTIESVGMGAVFLADSKYSKVRGVLEMEYSIVQGGLGLFAREGYLYLGSDGLNNEIRLQSNSVNLSTSSTRGHLQGYTDVCLGDRTFGTDAGCYYSRIMMNTPDSTRTFHINAVDVLQQYGNQADKWTMALAKGFRVLVSKTTSTTDIDNHGHLTIDAEGAFNIKNSDTVYADQDIIITSVANLLLYSATDQSGGVGIYNHAPGNALEVSASAKAAVVEISTWSTGTNASNASTLLLQKSNDNNVNDFGADSGTSAGEILGRIEAWGVTQDDTAADDVAKLSSYIEFSNDAVSSEGVVPGKIIFATAPSTDNSVPVVRMTIDDGGAVTLANSLSLSAMTGTGAGASVVLTGALKIGTVSFTSLGFTSTGSTLINTSSAALTITSAAAATWSTAAGALTLTSAAAATWSTAAGALTINGTAGVNIQEGGSTIIGIDDSRNITTTNTAQVDLDCSGSFSINSSGGVLNIGNDDVAQDISIGTGAAARVITMGNATGATGVAITSGTGDITIASTGHVEFDGCGVGFDRISGAFDATDSTVDFRTGNKAYLNCTGNTSTNLKMTFPDVSGNFILLINHPASGCNITNYLAYDEGGAAADGDTDVKFPGDVEPVLSNSENHVDILSFFWDADSETAYGVASLDFQN